MNGLKRGALPLMWWAAVSYGHMKHKRQRKDHFLSLNAGAKTHLLLPLDVSILGHLTFEFKDLHQQLPCPTPIGDNPECTSLSHPIQYSILTHKEQKLNSKIHIIEWF